MDLNTVMDPNVAIASVIGIVVGFWVIACIVAELVDKFGN